MIPRGPHELNLTHQIGNAPGQERFFALQQAVNLANNVGENDPDTVVMVAEKFHTFLAAEQG